MKKITVNAEELNMIQALRNQKALEQSAANANSNNGSNKTSATEESRKRNIDPMQQINTLVIKKHKSLPTDMQQNTDSWLSCIFNVLSTRKDKTQDYFSWILNRSNEVARTYDFKLVCENKGITDVWKQQAVAENLILKGKAVCNHIRLNGLSSYDGDITTFCDLIVPPQYRSMTPVTIKDNEDE